VHSSAIDIGAIPTPQSLADAPAPQKDASESPISLAPADAGDGAPAVADAPQGDAAPKPARPAAAAGGRHHTVARGDTLFSLAQKYYGSRSRWRDIYAANRDTLPSEKTPLKIGMDLKIP
jgi:nucleoid-associated protein YgaU